jgi:hypothetical protein
MTGRGGPTSANAAVCAPLFGEGSRYGHARRLRRPDANVIFVVP